MLHSAVALALCIQAQKAEEVYGRFEKSLVEAKCLRARVRSEWTTTSADGGIEAVLTLWCASGDKYKIAIEPKKGRDIAETTIISDGKNCWSRKSRKEEWHEGKAIPGMSTALLKGLARGSLLHFLYLSHGERPEVGDHLEVRKFGGVTNGTLGEREVLEFPFTMAVRQKAGDLEYRSRLWLEPKSLVPARRVLWHSDERGSVIMAEMYEAFSTEEIPESEFQKP